MDMSGFGVWQVLIILMIVSILFGTSASGHWAPILAVHAGVL